MTPPIILTVLQGLFLILLYVFVAGAVRAVLRDVDPASPRLRKPSAAPSARPQARQASSRERPRAAATQQPVRPPPGQIVVHASAGPPKIMPLGKRDITFGRGEQMTVHLTDPYTSDRHARIFFDGQRWMIADLGSTNGTFVNQVKVSEPTPIAAGDQLGIGRTVVEVRK